jgi:hypothetical protein
MLNLELETAFASGAKTIIKEDHPEQKHQTRNPIAFPIKQNDRENP